MAKRVFRVLAVFAALFLSVSSAFAAASPEPSDKTIKREIKSGRKGANEIEAQIPRVLDPSAEAKLAMIASRLTPYLQRDLEYSVRILEMKEPNAFSLPGGTTYFTTGMLDFLKSEDEIAAVMCHEFIHADRAHGIVQAKRNNALSLLTIAGLIAASQAGGSSSAGIAAMAGGLQTALMNSYSIDLEKEADARGIDVLRRAGYNPSAMLTMMERLKLEKMKRAQYQLGIYQTHPDEEERVEAALKYLRSNGITIERKDVVQSLKVRLDREAGRINLLIDDEVFVSAPEDEASERLFGELSERLDGSLELELAPYDVKTVETDGENVLMIGREKVLSESELLSGMPSLPELRDSIIASVNKARRGNLITDYYQ
jgi:predicted Zn-dependent protease